MGALIPPAMAVRFEQPWWLLAAIAAAGPVAAAIWARRRGRLIPASSVAMQCLAVFLAAAALARPTALIAGGAAKAYLILSDVSASVRGQADQPIPLPEDLPRETYCFATTVAPAGEALDANQTRAGAALRLATARRHDLAGVILRTDGRFTDDAWPAAAALGRAGLPVLILPLDSPPPDARIAAFSARRLDGGTVSVQITIESNALQRRTVTVRRADLPADRPLFVRRLDLLAGEAAGFSLTDTGLPTRAAAYTVQLSPGDEFVANDSAEAIAMPARRRLALVGSLPVALTEVAAAMKLPAEQIDRAAAPQSAAGWADYAAVVVADAEGTLLARAARSALAEYVRGGGGLVLIGAGPHASPSDRDDPLNQVAALLANPYQRRPLDVTVVLDASGSMSNPAAGAPGRKFDQAVEAVLSLRRHLTEADGLSVITFSDSARTIYESGRRPIDFATLRGALDGVLAAGPTDVMPALTLAAERPAAKGRDGLLLVVSDLVTRPFRPDRAAAMVRKARSSLAIVAIRSGAETQPGAPPLETLAKLLNAPLVRRNSLVGLADVFGRFLREARGGAIRRGRFAAAAPAPSLGLPAGALPEVRAYLLCAPQRGADVFAHVGEDRDALLAARQVGLGSSVSLALLVAPGENPEWERSGTLRRFLVAAVGSVLRAGDDPRFSGRLRRNGGVVSLHIDAADANGPMNLLELSARIVSPHRGGQPQDFALAQTGPGRYEGRTTAPRGAASVAVNLAGGQAVWRGGLGRKAPPELDGVGADWANLRKLANLTGGRIVRPAELGELGRRLARQRRSDLWPVFLALAVAVMLAEWAAARVRHRRA